MNYEDQDEFILNRVKEEYNNGTKYIGEKKNEKFHGFGTLSFPNGEVYEGEFKENKRNGYGKRFIKKSILIYEGEWSSDKYHGRGILYNPKFKRGGQLGKAVYENFNKLKNHQWEKFEGEFVEGKWHGVGILSLADGSKYNGQFTRNKVHGYGGIYKEDRSIQAGKW